VSGPYISNNQVVRPLDGYGAPLGDVVTTIRPPPTERYVFPQSTIATQSPVVEAARVVTPFALPQLPPAPTVPTSLPGVEAARAVPPPEGYGAPQGLVIGIKGSRPGRADPDQSPTPEPEVPEGFQSSHSQWQPMQGALARGMRMEEKVGSKEGAQVEVAHSMEVKLAHNVEAQVEVMMDPPQNLTQWVMPQVQTQQQPLPQPHPQSQQQQQWVLHKEWGYQPEPVTGPAADLAPPPDTAAAPWQAEEEAEEAPKVDEVQETTTKKTEVEDTLYTIFLQIMNQTNGGDETTMNPLARPESIEDIISFIKNVTNNTETFRNNAANIMEDLSNVEEAATRTFMTPFETTLSDLETTPSTTSSKTANEASNQQLILGRGVNGFITGIVRLQGDARFLYDPKTGALVSKATP